MTIYYYIIIFIIGLLFGSFYNVVGYRLSNEMSIVKPRSSCPNCGHFLKWYELIPIFSFLIQKAKCRNCKKKISYVYPLIELTTALLFLLSYYLYGFTYEFVTSIILSSFLVIVIVSDCNYYIIPDEVTLVFSVFLIIIKFLSTPLNSALHYLFMGILMFVIMYLIMLLGNFMFKKESLGGADIKLMFFIGLLLGFKKSMFVLLFASIIALPISIIFLIKDKNSIIPYGPFLLMSCFLIYIFNLDFATFFAF